MIGRPSRVRRMLVYVSMPLVFLPGLAILLAWITRTSVVTTTIGIVALLGLAAAAILLLRGFQRSIELARVLAGLQARIQTLETERAARQEAYDALAAREAQQRGTDRATAEAERSRALGQMAGGIAHSINQSLGLVSGYS